MANETQRVQKVTTQSGDTVARTTEVTQAHPGHSQNVISRVVWYIAGVLLVLLAFRFVLSLLGANTTNGFADFIYTSSHLFVSPFFGLFSYQETFGASHLEIYTLVAMAVYAIIAWGIAKLLTLNRPE